MRRLDSRVGRQRWLLGFAVVALIGVSSVVLALSIRSAPEPGPFPAYPVDLRFPAEWRDRVSMSVAEFALARAPRPGARLNATALDWLSAPLVLDAARRDFASFPAMKAALPGDRDGADKVGPDAGSRDAPIRHDPGRRATLLNEAQIASIRERLRLSPDQEQFWPPVEAALRAIAWRGPREKLNHKTATLDPKSLEKMTTALGPFLRKLRTDQKDELRSLAHLMGLERLASEL